jgi:hypothetical protein
MGVNMVRAGFMLLFGAWVPLVAVGLMDPESNPIGLGLLALAGSLVGAVLIAIGMLVALFHLAR